MDDGKYNPELLSPIGSTEHLPLQPIDPATQGNGGAPESFSLIAGSQANVVNLSSLITNPNLKRSESSDLLNLTLHQCARDGNPELMERLLRSLQGNVKKKVNAHDDEDLSPLHYAARYNHYDTVKLLISFGANVLDVDEEGATALHFAARYKRMRLKNADEDPQAISSGNDEAEEVPMVESTVDNSVILYLVHSKAVVNARDMYGCTPLHFAAMRGNEVATKELLSCPGVNVEAVDKQMMTALHMAASHYEVEICRMLIEAKANLRCCDEEQATPLHYACMEGSMEIAQMLFEAGEGQDGWVTVSKMLNDQDNQDNTPLHYAVENRSYDVTKLCIERGADVNVTRNNYSTPLHLAAVAGDVKIVQLLLDHKARKDALDINQSTPLHKAAAYNHADVVEFLLDGGANIEKHDKDNFSPLLIAACNGHAETIRRLLGRGANPYHVDKNDKTAIFWAAEEDKIEALKVLLEHPRARQLIDATDRYDNAPLHIAAQKGFLNCVKLLLDAEGDMDAKNEEEQTPLHLAAKFGKTHVVRELVKRNKMVINDEDEDSNTALHLAALAGHNKVVLGLIEAGADIEARNCTLWTPLDCAAAKGWPKVVRSLLEADAPVDPMDKSKTTPLHLAASRGHVEVVNLLIRSHASIGQKDSSNLNCLDMAIDNGHKDVANAIISSEKWEEALRNQTDDEKTGRRVTPMRKLIRKMPEVAETVFNRCMTSMNHPDHPNFQITFDYEFLDDMYALWDAEGADSVSVSADSIYDEEDRLISTAEPYTSDATTLKINHPLSIMVSCNREDLLAHPLITSLLRHKWNSFGRWVYYLNLAAYCIFVIFLTGFVVTTDAPYSFTNSTELNKFNGSECEKVEQFMQSIGESVSQHRMAFIAKYIIIILSAINILREIVQIFNAKLNYLGWENLIEWVIYISALLLVIDFDTCQRNTGLRTDWQWQLAAVSIFLAWIDLVLFIRKFPMFGIYVVMFTDICKTFIQFFPVLILFMVAFALALYVLLSNQYAFRNVGHSMMKTAVMMIGELEYSDIFLAMEGLDPNDPANSSTRVFYKELTYILFSLFLVILTIIIMNLLVGLAVDDIKAVQDKAELTRLAMQVELALNVESVLPQIFRRKYVVKCKTVYPNQYSSALRKCLQLDSTFITSAAITKALNPDLDDMERLEANQEKMKQGLMTLRTRVKNMEAQNSRLESMLKALLTNQGIEFEEEDAQDDQVLGSV